MSKVKAKTRLCAWMYPTNLQRRTATRLSRGWNHYEPKNAPRSELTYYREFLHQILGAKFSTPPLLRCTTNYPATEASSRIGLCISGSSTNWPQSNWLQLSVELSRIGKTLILFGGNDAKELATQISSRCAKVQDFTGKLTFAGSVPHLADLELLIGNDTGFTHFASLIVRKLMVILGGGTFGRFFPWPETERQFVIFNALECYDCGWQCKFKTPECLNLISPPAVCSYAQNILEGTAPRMLNLNSSNVKYQVGWRYEHPTTECVDIPGSPTINP